MVTVSSTTTTTTTTTAATAIIIIIIIIITKPSAKQDPSRGAPQCIPEADLGEAVKNGTIRDFHHYSSVPAQVS